MQIDIRAMQLEDYENVLALWQGMPGIGLSSADSKAALAQFLSRNPGLSLVMTLSMFSLAGIPPVAGFFGKFFLFTAAAEKGYYLLVTIAVLNTIISLYYYLLVVKAMFINASESPVERFRSDFPTKFALGICVAGIFLTGFASSVFEAIRNFSFGI